jgi:hypothetical protein
MGSITKDDQRRARIADLFLVGVLTAVAIGGFVFINPTDAQVNTGPGGLSWRTLPYFYSGILLALVGLFAAATLYDLHLIARNERPRSLLGERVPDSRDPVTRWRRFATVAVLLAYAFGIEAFGFAIMTPLLLLVMFHILGRPDFWRNVAVALIGGLVTWILFVGILKMPLQGNFWDPLTPVLKYLFSLTGAR